MFFIISPFPSNFYTNEVTLGGLGLVTRKTNYMIRRLKHLVLPSTTWKGKRGYRLFSCLWLVIYSIMPM